jgi:antitoxin PrlF
MSGKSYKVSWAKIGNSAGYRLASDFFKENPNFVGAEGVVQVIAPDTVLLSLTKSEPEDQAEDELMLRLYLDFLTKQALANPNELEEYTAAMAEEDDALIAGVELDAD